MKKRINVLIPDGEFGNTRQVLFCLSNSKDYQISILSNRNTDFIKYSRYCKKFYVADETAFGDKRLKNIIDIIEKDCIDILFPTFVPCCQLVIEHIEALKSITGVILLPDLQNYNIAANKDLFGKFCLANNIATPKTSGLHDLSILDEISNYRFPVLLKPSDGDGGIGIMKFNQAVELKLYIENNLEHIRNKYILQEFIEAIEIDANILCVEGEILTYTIQKGFIPPNRPFSFSKGVEMIQYSGVFEFIKPIFKELNWSGIAHIDLLYDSEKEQIYILEINPRIWGTIIASFRAGVNFPDLLIKKSLKSDFNAFPSEYKKIKYANLSKQVLGRIFQNSSSLKLSETNLSLLAADPLPSIIARYFSLIGKSH
jgi:D-aspartate ligase